MQAAFLTESQAGKMADGWTLVKEKRVCLFFLEMVAFSTLV